jgi:Zn-finger protein
VGTRNKNCLWWPCRREEESLFSRIYVNMYKLSYYNKDALVHTRRGRIEAIF